MNVQKPSIHWLAEFGLSIGQLAALGSVKIRLQVHLRHIHEQSLFKLKPSQRIEKTKRHYELLLSRLKKNWRDGPLDVCWTRRQPRAFSAFVEARHVSRLLQMPEIGSIWIDEVPGRKRVGIKPKERWFAIKARFAIQVEEQTTGLQSYEDRIVMVRAISFEDAEKKLQPEFKQYGTPYLNPRGYMARWAFERVLDVYEIGEEKIDPRGVEIFSVLGQRRMKPEYAWKIKRSAQIRAK